MWLRRMRLSNGTTRATVRRGRGSSYPVWKRWFTGWRMPRKVSYQGWGVDGHRREWDVGLVGVGESGIGNRTRIRQWIRKSQVFHSFSHPFLFQKSPTKTMSKKGVECIFWCYTLLCMTCSLISGGIFRCSHFLGLFIAMCSGFLAAIYLESAWKCIISLRL